MFVLLSILLLGLLIVVHELGHFMAARLLGIRVSRFSIGFGPVLARYQGPEVEYALRALPLGGYVGFPDEDPESNIAKDDPNLLKNRPVLDRTIVLSAGIVANLIFGYLVLVLMVAIGGVPVSEQKPGVLIQQVSPGASPASQAGLKAGDVLLTVDGKSVGSGENALEATSRAFKASPGRPLRLVVRRDRQQVPIAVTPSSEGKVGVSLTPNATVEHRPPQNPVEIFTSSWNTYGRIASTTFSGFAQLFSGRAGIDQLSGPVGIVAVTAQAAQSDWLNLFFVGALISFNLAILNLLPFPALDGGQLVFVGVEAVRGKPLDERIQRIVTQTGLVVLLGLGLVLIFKDSLSLLGG
ncbi:RIP metalloprotease RseP [Gloeobacter kilaueensis]|uniref:Zinc metalloprotease n=1 Tax=Gloeobacter kilaueensis (strain ATCC BAA-2537 / CCAP 1431/1 / ULC 316 / JS1) TaxID=1183438 RepID=U5QD87_GLOK1|nr:RIP metalloprotease RseP [Gloeobacter kilaueensis]AGY56882.1 regulator of sigma E protease [Gloeobacter kilaueensis JS1]